MFESLPNAGNGNVTISNRCVVRAVDSETYSVRDKNVDNPENTRNRSINPMLLL